jgi:ABC-2 type transport system permease protein
MKALMSSEVRKLTSTFGPPLVVGVMLAVPLLGMVLNLLQGGQGFDEAGAALASPVIGSVLVAANLGFVLGMLVTGTDHRYGVTVPTHLANPRRGRVLAAKLIVAGSAGTAVAAVVFVLAVAVGFPILASQGVDLGGIVADPRFWWQAVLAVLTTALVTTLGAAVTAFVHSLLAAVAIAVAVTIVEVMTLFVDWIPLDFTWTFSHAVQNMSQGIVDVSERAPWMSALVVVGWVAVYVVAASVRALRQDVA